RTPTKFGGRRRKEASASRRPSPQQEHRKLFRPLTPLSGSLFSPRKRRGRKTRFQYCSRQRPFPTSNVRPRQRENVNVVRVNSRARREPLLSTCDGRARTAVHPARTAG